MWFIIFVLAIIMFYFLRRPRKVTISSNQSLETSKKFGSIDHFVIPEPTRSLLWITNEDISKISSPFEIKCTLNISGASSRLEVDDGRNFYGEPSLIWSKLPIEKSLNVETRQMYWPSYSALSPDCRYQYLAWLKDVTCPTNLSYVFLYYYGLERHLLVGDYDAAVDEILRLLKHHTKGSLMGYASTALLLSSIRRKRFDILDRAPFLVSQVRNETLLVRKLIQHPLSATDVINLASVVGFTNKRYIKAYPNEFLTILQTHIDSFQKENGLILDLIDFNSLEMAQTIAFANTSLPEKIRCDKIQRLIESKKLHEILHNLLLETHELIKVQKKKKSVKRITDGKEHL